MEKGLAAPLHKPSEPISKSSAKGLEAPFSIGRIFTAKAQSQCTVFLTIFKT
jgi:hypothetical protein